MRESKTHFEQMPVAVVKRIAEEVHDDVAGNDDPVTSILPSKLKPHRSASLKKHQKVGLTMQLSEPKLNCSICDKPVTLEAATTDEVGRAAHKECYLLKLGIKPDSNYVQASKSVQSKELTRSTVASHKQIDYLD
jgi:hypothetical protein